MKGNFGNLEYVEIKQPILKYSGVKKQFTREIRKYLEINENENTI